MTIPKNTSKKPSLGALGSTRSPKPPKSRTVGLPGHSSLFKACGLVGLLAVAALVAKTHYGPGAVESNPAAATTAPAPADGSLDTTRLPRIEGAKELYASPYSTLFTSPRTVAETSEFVRKSLSEAGWQRYMRPFTAYDQNPSFEIMSFKKGPQMLAVSVSVAPAQGNATAVSFTSEIPADDLPFPADAADIAYDPSRPHLECVTAKPVADTLAFFSKELGALGWSPFVPEAGSRVAASQSDDTASAFFTRTGKDPLHLSLGRNDQGRIKVELKSVPAELLTAKNDKTSDEPQPPSESAQPVASNGDTAEAPPETGQKIFSPDELMLHLTEAMRLANTQVKVEDESGAPDTATGADQAPLHTRSANTLPIPLPETADDVEFEGASGRLEFNSASSVSALAEFYRGSMKPLGWKEQLSVINQANMVVLNYAKGDQDLSITILQIGKKVNVTASGSGLETAAGQTADSGQTSPAPEAAAEAELESEEMSGFPVPKSHTMSFTEGSKFRNELHASVPAKLDAVLAFYRRELGKLGWREAAKGPATGAGTAILPFTSPNGPGVLTLGRKDGETTVSLTLRKNAEAQKAGIVSPAGKAKVIFGSMADKAASVTLNKRTIELAAGMGSEKPNGPTLELSPGTYKYSFKFAGEKATTEEVVIGADETWAIVVGPGGAMSTHLY